ncbi:MAG: hypothetical protein V1796_02655 [Pseudomonadota bacterium]
MTLDESHRRSLAYGRTNNDKPNFDSLVGSDLTLLVEQNQSLQIHVFPGMEPPCEQIVNTNNFVITTHANGLIVVHSPITISWNKQIGARTIPASSGPNKARARTQSELQS